MLRIYVVLVVIIHVVALVSAVRVYEENSDLETPTDVGRNYNSTGPVVYPEATTNSTEETPGEKNETSDGLKVIGLDGGHQLDSSSTDKLTNKTEDISRHSISSSNSSDDADFERSVNNLTRRTSVKVKENSPLKRRESSAITKPFVSSPKDVATRISHREESIEDESFQPMIENPFLPSPPHAPHRFTQIPTRHQHYQYALPNPRPEEPLHQNSAQDIVFRDPQEDGRHSNVQNLPNNNFDPRSNHFKEAPPPSINYGPFHKNIFPSEAFPRDQQSNFNSLHEYVQHNDKPGSENNQLVAWPEHVEHESPKYSHSPSWTTEEPEFQTHTSNRYYPAPTEYAPAKGFFSSALSMIAQSLKPSIPTHPYPFELTEQQPKNYFETTSSSTYQLLPPSSISSSDTSDGSDFGKYQIITTPPPEYHFPSASPGFQHGTEVDHRAPNHHPQLPWHKILKVLTAIVPLGLLVSALTPNVVLISPNATSPKPIGNIYSYVTRQRSLEPDNLFDQKIMDILNGIEEESSQANCIRHAICQAIKRNEAEDLTSEEHEAFQNKLCRNLEDTDIPVEC